MGFAKLKVDGAVSKASNIGVICVICRNSVGSYMGAFARVFAGITDPATLKALACREVLALANNLMETQLVVGSDCKEIIANIKEGNGGNHGHMI